MPVRITSNTIEKCRSSRQGFAARVLRPWPRGLAILHGARLAVRPCRWLFRVHAVVLPRLARPFIVGGTLMASGVLLEALQALTPDRHCDFRGALYSVAGALAAGLVVDLFTRRRLRLIGPMLSILPRFRPGPRCGVTHARHRRRSASSVPLRGVARGYHHKQLMDVAHPSRKSFSSRISLAAFRLPRRDRSWDPEPRSRHCDLPPDQATLRLTSCRV